jgi:hypothetical protein
VPAGEKKSARFFIPQSLSHFFAAFLTNSHAGYNILNQNKLLTF